MNSKVVKAIVFVVLIISSISCAEQTSNTVEILPAQLDNTLDQETDFKTQWHWLFQKSGSDKLSKEELEIIEKITEKTADKSNRQELPFPKQYDLLDSINQ